MSMQEGKANVSNLLAAMAIGAGCMYLLDPVYGKRRRALIRDKFARISHVVEGGTGVVARDLTNRTWGMAASVGRIFRHGAADDSVLVPRVRSEMGRWVSHPHAIHVEAQDGRVIVSGDILASELREFLRHVGQVSGVKVVESHLKAHERPEDLPSLQGGSMRESRFELMQTHWAPGPRVLVGVAGSALIAHGIRNRGIIGTAISVAGSLLLFRAVTNIELKRLIGAGETAEKPEGKRKAGEGVSIPVTHSEPTEYRVH